MKISLLNNLYSPYHVGGAERSVESLANGLVQLGHEITVLTLHEGRSIDVELNNGIRIFRIPLRNYYWPFGAKHRRASWQKVAWHARDLFNIEARRDLLRVIGEIRPDVVHTNNVSGFSVSAWGAASSLGIPVVHTARDYHLLHPNSTLFGGGGAKDELSLDSRLWVAGKRSFSRRVNCFVAISEYVREIHLRAGLFEHALASVIYNSVSTPDRDYRPAALKAEKIYGFIGRLDPSKGVEKVIEAARLLPGRRWIIAGEGQSDYVDSLRRLAPSNVDFIGKVRPSEFFSKINVLMIPSLWAEPLGRVAIEAYMHGIPVISSGLGGLGDIVKDGLTGFFFDPFKVQSLLDAVAKLDAEDYQKLVFNCNEYSRRFTEISVAGQYIEVYGNAIAGRR
ncbi:glycosyltransferase family 4 protein [Stenotrophomonas maltophilia]|uniref:Glycosyltransferase family 4 protein n=1 Tax=Stenotrophomonas riyadhensis TaxID=2859893 RepID=A0ABT2XBW7_9GAMM|nr:glycosyltransferase family 4 protein [Stenotrophomonas sp. CFS3442]MBH1617099.1 glycosyltransferase family 4 protein [Stenotrophomonas maltophilia]MCV0323432.1 glycosyltransferase family 4 protein [Stenotrophomonas sp. CFS3442]HEL4242868.1 glycosyltransferase family 4 protein [Stenotrophomonas maltophilia]